MTLHLYGLRISSELPLHHNRYVTGEGPEDVVIRFGRRTVLQSEPPPGHVLVHVEIDRPYLTCTRSDHGYVARFYRTCDFVVDRDLRQVRVDMVDGASLDMAAVYATGTFLSFLLALRGDPVLHASAVRIGDGALAFVGRSGMGKSTMATLMCADGAELVTDDVLRLDLTGVDVSCFLGATELRLRKSARELADRFVEQPEMRRTVDERTAIRATPATRAALPLSAIVIPIPDREHDSCEVNRVPPAEAVLTLLQYPRVLGWEDPSILQRQFEQLVEVVERTPVYAARVPWGPPFPSGIAAAVRAATGMQTDAMSLGSAERP